MHVPRTSREIVQSMMTTLQWHAMEQAARAAHMNEHHVAAYWRKRAGYGGCDD